MLSSPFFLSFGRFLELAFAIAICLWLLALNSNKTFFWSSDFVPGLPIPASKAQVLFLFDQMIDFDFEFREESVDQVSSWMFQTTGLPAFASDRDSKCALMRTSKCVFYVTWIAEWSILHQSLMSCLARKL
jgi:hypothetical protein